MLSSFIARLFLLTFTVLLTCVTIAPARAGQNQRIYGTLVDQGSTPISGVKVVFSDGDEIKEATTNEQGNFSVTIPTVRHKFYVADDPTWLLKIDSFKLNDLTEYDTSRVDTLPDSTWDFGHITRTFVAKDGALSVTMTLKVVHGSVGGKITIDGHGLMGIGLSGTKQVGSKEEIVPESPKTGTDGSYRFTKTREAITLKPKELASIDGKTYAFEFSPDEMKASPGRVNANFKVTKGPIAGSVLDAVGNGLEQVKVELTPVGKTEVTASTETNDEGFFRFSNLAAAQSYSLKATRPGYYFGAPLDFRRVGTTDVKMRLLRGSIAGTVKASPETTLKVTLFRVGMSEPRASKLVTVDATDASRRFDFERLDVDGEFRVTVEGTGNFRHLVFPPVVTRPGAVNLSIQPVPAFHGVVKFGPNGLEGIEVSAHPSDGSGDPITTITARDGSYHLRGLERDLTYKISAEPSKDIERLSIDPNGFDNPVTADSDRSQLNFIATRTIRGRITALGNNTSGIGGIIVRESERTATTDDDGHFVLRGYDSSDATVTVIPTGETQKFEPARRVKVQIGTEEVNFEAQQGIAGHVTFTDGSSVPNLAVTVTSTAVPLDPNFAAAQTARTEADGSFFMAGAREDRKYVVRPERAGFTFQPAEKIVRGVDKADFRITQSPPLISPINDQIVHREGQLSHIYFQVSDRHQTPASQLTVTAKSSNPDVVADSQLQLSGSGEHRSLTLKAESVIGESDITLTVRDRDQGESKTTFTVKVGATPEFAVEPFPQIPGSQGPTELVGWNNDILVARAKKADESVALALWGAKAKAWKNVAIEAPSFSPIGMDGNGRLLSENHRPRADVGAFVAERVEGTDTFRPVFVAPGDAEVSQSGGERFRLVTSRAINQDGDVIYVSDVKVPTGKIQRKLMLARAIYDKNKKLKRYVIHKLAEVEPVDLPDGPGIRLQDLVTLQTDADVLALTNRAPNGTIRVLASKSRTEHFVYEISNDGEVSSIEIKNRERQGDFVVPIAMDPLGELVAVQVHMKRNAAPSSLLQFPIGVKYFRVATKSYSKITRLTGTEQRFLVHSIGERAETTGEIWYRNGKRTGFYWLAGDPEYHELDELVTPRSWTIKAAKKVNNQGQIIAKAVQNGGKEQLVKLVHAVVVGQRVPQPQGTVAAKPDIVPESIEDAFVWSESEQALYAVREVNEGELKWRTKTDPREKGRISSKVYTVWPRDVQRHVVGAPVDIQPAEAKDFPYTFTGIAFRQDESANVDLQSHVFNTSKPGFTVLQYVETRGQAIDPSTQRLFFKVVESRPRSDEVFHDPKTSAPRERSHPIGEAIMPINEHAKWVFEFEGDGNDFAIFAKRPGKQYDGMQVNLGGVPRPPSVFNTKDAIYIYLAASEKLAHLNKTSRIIQLINSSKYYVARSVNGEDDSGVIPQSGIPTPSTWSTIAGGTLDHDDYAGRTAFVFDVNNARAPAPIDAAGERAAYDVTDRTGTILPVNLSKGDGLDVVWYRQDSIGIAWADRPVRYKLRWPKDASEIVIADQPRDSAYLPKDDFEDQHIYRQPDPTAPGCNPNEEHAFIVNETVAALRSDINSVDDMSKPYVLVKYRRPEDNAWRMKVFSVKAEDQRHGFHYPGLAGQEIQPPFPLSSLPLCRESFGAFGPIWKDVKGKLYAYAAGDGGTDTTVTVRYFYPRQPDFFVPQSWEIEPGDCMAWLRGHKSTTLLPPGAPQRTVDSDPVDVLYTVSWPADIPTMKIGETLLSRRDGLPEIYSQARAEVIYQAMNPTGAPYPGRISNHSDSVVRIYDPISERVVPLSRVPGYLKTVRDEQGRKMLPSLPYHLQLRVRVDDRDPADVKLIFRGFNLTKNQPPGQPLLLPNIMSAAERDSIIELDAPDNGVDAVWQQAVKDLCVLTRDPNQLASQLAQAAGANDLLVGLDRAYLLDDGDLVREIPEQPVALTSVVAPQLFENGPKALTTALPLTKAGMDRLHKEVDVSAVRLNGVGDVLEFGPNILPSGGFTLEMWFKKEAGGGPHQIVFAETNETRVGGEAQAEGRSRYLAIDGSGRFRWNDGSPLPLNVGGKGQAVQIPLNEWHHLAWVMSQGKRTLYLDGKKLFESRDKEAATSIDGSFTVGGLHGQRTLAGTVRDIRVWRGARDDKEILALMRSQLSGKEAGLAGYWPGTEGFGRYLFDRTGRRHHGFLNGANWTGLEKKITRPNGYVTMAFNNARDLSGLPVSLEILRVVPELHGGDLRVIPSANIFDERLTLRSSNDFGGAADAYEFQWYYHRGSQSPIDKNKRPQTPSNPSGNWLLYRSSSETALTPDANQITLGEGKESGLMVISDNRWWMRFRPKSDNALADLLGKDTWSDWVGAPGLDPQEAQLAEGWIKRVTRALNPFDARTDDFRNSPVNTYASLLISAGRRYEGPIAFNPDADNVNKIGLIEAYETVLRRGRQLSIDGTPPVVNDAAANQALLHAASKIADLYMMLGNEAFADAMDPTIGFTTPSGQVGTLAPSIFAFQNQLPSLLEEELALLRGIDRSSGLPAYNRLRWNFTGAEGQLAYVQVYNVRDIETRSSVTGEIEPKNGFIDVNDAAFMYPQGHGDAWGHYLTAIKSYYNLLRHDGFQWNPRPESMLLGGTPVDVHYLDERKFANIAAARARTGAEIASLTYRLHYDADPGEPFDGYSDSDVDRAWGASEWSRRAGQAAYFDWVAANANLPDIDPDRTHEGIQRVDRSTVVELDEIASTYEAVQTLEDNASAGLNPLGLVDSALAFDVDPQSKLTQFEQIRDRANKAMENAVAVFNYANELTQNLRRTQDSAADFAENVADQEASFTNRLIEVFGYPPTGQIGPGKPYATGYNGPDLLFYQYVKSSDLTNEAPGSPKEVTQYIATARDQIETLSDLLPASSASSQAITTARMEVNLPISQSGWPFVSPSDWGPRLAPGSIQTAISGLLQSQVTFQQSLEQYSNQLRAIDNKLRKLEVQFNFDREKLSILGWQKDSTIGFNTAIATTEAFKVGMERFSAVMKDAMDAEISILPKVLGLSNDPAAPVRTAIMVKSQALRQYFGISADVAGVAGSSLKLGKDQLNQETQLKIFAADADARVKQQVLELEQMIRQEAPLRLGLHKQRENIEQAHAHYRSEVQRGQRLLEQREAFRRKVAGNVSRNRYRDMTFRVFRNDATQKYRAQFDVAARYVYLAAKAYDYETTLLQPDDGAARRYYEDIVRERALGEWINGRPMAGRRGLADSLARLSLNFDVLKGQLGLNNTDSESGVFSLKSELYRIDGDTTEDTVADAPALAAGIADLDDLLAAGENRSLAKGADWKQVLRQARIEDLWQIPSFRRHCRPFSNPASGAQPALVLRFATTITDGQNFFGWPIAGGESSFDATQFATKIRSVGVVFEGYPSNLSKTPRVYLIPVGTDILRSADGANMATRSFKVIDQKVPVPFPIGGADLSNRNWIPQIDGLSGSFVDVRRHSRLRALGVRTNYGEQLKAAHQTTSSRLVGRSAWNTQWLLIIPGRTLLNDSEIGLERFIENVTDIKLTLQTYAASGN